MADKKISQLNSATLPLSGTEEISIVQSGETKKITATVFKSDKLDKVTTVDVEKVYIKNADGTQGVKATSEIGSLYNASSWLVDKLIKVVSNNFVNTAILGGNFFGGSSPNANSFKTMLGVGIMSGTNANGGGRYLIEPANALRVTQGLSFYGCFNLGQTTRDNFIRIGFLSSQLNTTAVTNGVWLQINTATATLNTANNSVSSQSTSAVLSAGAYYEFLIECVTTSSVTCKIKEVLTGTVVFSQTLSTNVPEAIRTFQCGLVASITTAGASNTIISIQELSFGIKPDYLKNF